MSERPGSEYPGEHSGVEHRPHGDGYHSGVAEPGPGGEYGGPISGAPARRRPSAAAKVGTGVGRGVKAAAKGTSAAGRATYRVTRRATHADGAGDTGLSRLLEVHGLHNAGDAVVAISLAGTLFFQVPSDGAREQVALFLLLTLLPFSVLAPFISPFLDRFRQGRRWAIGSMMAVRAFLCWVLSTNLDNAWWQFPAALGILIASKAYNVSRSAATPRLLPPQLTLVKANGRMSLAGIVCAAIATPIAVGAASIGPQWSLRFAFVIFVIGTILAILLPAQVDSSKGEQDVSMAAMSGRRRSLKVPARVVTGLRANVGLRMLSGFLTIFLAFLLRNDPLPGWEGRFTLLLGVIVAMAGVGSALGTVLGSLMRSLPPLRLVKISLVLDVVVAVVAAVHFSLVTVLLLSFTVGMCQQLGKLALDATIQQEVPEHVRTSVFGLSETMIQLAWVLGGGLGVVLPSNAGVGMTVVAVLMVLWLIVVLRGTRAVLRRETGPRRRMDGQRPDLEQDAGDDAGDQDPSAWDVADQDLPQQDRPGPRPQSPGPQPGP